jgi:hypothetical protein
MLEGVGRALKARNINDWSCAAEFEAVFMLA